VTGFVYLMGNVSMPDIYKIGMTMRSAQERADELSAPSGLPTPFEVLCAVELEDPRTFERRMHRFFCHNRVSETREFFRFANERPFDTILTVICEMAVLSAISVEVTPAADKYLARHSPNATYQELKRLFASQLVGEEVAA
jgi:hypothetical protein